MPETVNPDHPFSPVHARQSFLETSVGGEALRRLEDALGAREPFLLVTGAAGTGKTALAHEAIARWGPRVAAAMLTYPALTAGELLEECIRHFGATPPEGASRPKLVASLEAVLAEVSARGCVAMLVVDDAHLLAADLLEELRLIVNVAQRAGHALEVLLLGLPDLEARIDDPAAGALRQRVSVRARLEPLAAGETRRYLRHRVAATGGDGAQVFPRRTCDAVASLACGIPRQINVLAAEALRLARLEGETAVDPRHVAAAAAALGMRVPAGAAQVPVATRERGAGAPATGGRAAEESAKAAPPPVVPAKPVASGAAGASIPVEAPPSAGPASPTRSSVPGQDRQEWVARFVGDRGPVQIGCLAGIEPELEPGPPEPGGGDPETSRTNPRNARHPAGSGRRRRGAPRRRGTRALTTVALVVTVAIAAAVLAPRWREIASRDAGRAAVVTAEVAAPGSATTPVAGARDARPAGEAPPARTPVPSAPAAAAPARPAPAPAPPGADEAAAAAPGRGPFTIEVAASRNLQLALDERNRLEELTGIEGWVVPAPAGGDAPHRVVIGVYGSYERARRAADMLVRTRTLPAAAVAPLPPPDARR